MTVLWPRLERTVAEALLVDFRGLGRRELSDLASTRHPTQTFASTGGRRVTEEEVAEVRDAIVDVATGFGFPGDPVDPVGFDRAMAPRLFELMPLSVGEALTRQVWTFLSTIVAPDVTHWRFVRSTSSAWNHERWVCTDRTRHMFSRLWWQARQLGCCSGNDPDLSLLKGLSESELNHLTERTSIGGCVPLVRAVASFITELDPADRQRDVVRNGVLRVNRLIGVIDPYALSEAELALVVRRVFGQPVPPDTLPSPTGRPVRLHPPR